MSIIEYLFILGEISLKPVENLPDTMIVDITRRLFFPYKVTPSLRYTLWFTAVWAL